MERDIHTDVGLLGSKDHIAVFISNCSVDAVQCNIIQSYSNGTVFETRIHGLRQNGRLDIGKDSVLDKDRPNMCWSILRYHTEANWDVGYADSLPDLYKHLAKHFLKTSIYVPIPNPIAIG